MEQRGLLCILFVVCVGLQCVDCTDSNKTSVANSAPTKTTATAATMTSAKTTASAATKTSAKTTASAATMTSAKTTASAATMTSAKTTAPVATTASVLTIPNSFYYNCTDDGGIEIINNGDLSNIVVGYLNQSATTCVDPTQLSDGSIRLSNCTKNSTVDIILEASNETGIIGGQHSKTFKIKCETVNIKPYYLNATVNGNIGGQSNPSVVAMATTPTPTPVTSLLMVIKDTNNTIVTRAEIGQKLTIAIKIPDKTTIKPTECKASGNGKEVTLWTESGCTYNEDLFGTNWLKRNETSEISNTMYGFRFVGSESVTILCSVRVCPDGYKGDKCDLTCVKKRKRTNRLSDDVTMEQASASLAITDSAITSGAERLRLGLCNTISFVAAAVLVLVNVKFTRE